MDSSLAEGIQFSEFASVIISLGSSPCSPPHTEGAPAAGKPTPDAEDAAVASECAAREHDASQRLLAARLALSQHQAVLIAHAPADFQLLGALERDLHHLVAQLSIRAEADLAVKKEAEHMQTLTRILSP